MPPEARFLNIAAYRFVTLNRLPERRAELAALGKTHSLRGTILLSPEGINLFVAGAPTDVLALVTFLDRDPATRKLDVKESYSSASPFRRFLVKIKTEIIAFGDATICPEERTAPRVAPTTLKSWLDEGQPVVLLDVRNDYEIQLGSFASARPIGISHFRDFVHAAAQLPVSLREARVVTFCTGGIRCEKAAPHLQKLGFQDVWQLDGGILKYFEACGSDHYRGECFVFDHRVAVDAHLSETSTVQCFACRTPLVPSDQLSPHYRPGVSCPYCFKTEREQQSQQLSRRNNRIAAICQILPGSQPYTNRRKIWVASEHDGMRTLDFLYQCHPYAGRQAWEKRLRDGLVWRNEQRLLPNDLVRRGDCLEHLFPNTTEPDVSTDISVLYEDRSIVVIHKPAPLPVHPCGRFNRNTLVSILNQVYAPARLRLAHRIDANTTGVVVLSRSAKVARRLQPQFEERQVHKEYLVRVRGNPPDGDFTCQAPIGATPVQGGVRITESAGQLATTHFRVLRRFPDGTSLLRAEPITGRTNQIRIHVWHMGFPIVGEPTYLADHRIGSNRTLEISDEPLSLHAHRIRFRHPFSNEQVEFVASPPAWAVE